MKSKGYIAILLVSIFVVKFIAIDAQALNTLFSEHGITLFNKYCKKESVKKQSTITMELSQSDNFGVDVIDMAGFCTSQFNFTHFSWETNQSKPIVDYNKHCVSNLSYLHLDKVSPPPQLA